MKNIKLILIVVAIIIAFLSLFISNILIRDLQKEEATNMDVWAEAMRSFNAADDNTDLNLVLKVINGNNTIPVIVLDKQGNIVTHRNLDINFSKVDSVNAIFSLAHDMRSNGNVIRINFDNDNDYNEICFDDSIMLKRLATYPYIQLCIVVIFVLIALFALFSSMKAEQNKVWVGLSKETAHQLGTPISSLMAWTEVLKDNYPQDDMLGEMEKDVKRLERIAERFSKIGSIPEPKDADICELIRRVVEYMNVRTSNKVVINTHNMENPVVVSIVSSLFEWVIENLCKNAVDAMNGSGKIDIFMQNTSKLVILEISDTGKGMPRNHYKDVFKPGFTTKKRGWGLGLSLAKRIVEQYHKGKIFVKYSEIGKGTTFRIELPKK